MTAHRETFIAELDAAVQAHLEWSGRVLRCAVLRTPAGEDVESPGAHTLCGFARWLAGNRARLDAFDPQQARHLEATHRAIHDAGRTLCARALAGMPGRMDDVDAFEHGQSALIETLGRFKTLALQSSAQRDPLTRLPLRHHIGHDFELLRKHGCRDGSGCAVMMIDVDRFKRINDRHGHAAGDLVLRQASRALRRAVRDSDLLYRYGGEEFVLLMRYRSVADIDATAQRILHAVRSASIRLPGGATVTITVTVGIAFVGEHETLHRALERADWAMYEGKAAGRDCHVLAAETLAA